MGQRKEHQTARSNEELVALIQQGDESCIEDLLKQNEGFIHAVMTDMGIQDSPESKEYLQSGRVGLLRSIPKYDPARGTKFLTYAKAWIRKEMGSLRAQNIKFGHEIPLSRIERKFKQARPDWEEVNPIEDTLAKQRDVRTMEKGVLHMESIRIIHECIRAMGPRERQFLVERYGFYDCKPLGRNAIAEKYHLPIHEVFPLEERVHEYIRESLLKGKVSVFPTDTLDPKNQERQTRKAYEDLFEEPGEYLENLMADFADRGNLEYAEE